MQAADMRRDPFALDDVSVAVRPLLNWTLALRDYRALYREVTRPDDPRLATLPFERRVLGALAIHVDAPASDVTSIPARGPLMIASNHPHGILDGLALLALLRPLRPDLRVVTNRLLARIPELHDFCFFVDPFDRPAATARSLGGLRAAHLWLRKGGAVIVFPAGEVAHGPIEDACGGESAWKPTMARLAGATGAVIVRAHIEGRNSALFYAAGRVHPALRTALLAREFLKKRGASITVRLKPDTTGAIDVPSVVSGFNRTVVPVVSGFSRTVVSVAPRFNR